MTAPREVSAAERAARDAAADIAYNEHLSHRWRRWAFEYLRALDTCPTCGGTGHRRPTLPVNP